MYTGSAANNSSRRINELMILHGREGRIVDGGSTNSVYLNGDVRCQIESN